MNDEEFAERPSGFMFGKEFIIVLVIIFSGMSFTLGFFVGKSTTPDPVSALQAVESPAQLQKLEMSPVSPSQSVAPVSEQAQITAPVQLTVSSPIKDPVSPAAPASEKPVQQQIAKETAARPVEGRESSQQQNAQLLLPKSFESQASKSAPDKSPLKTASAPSSDQKDVLYTVQIGAFKNSSDAKHLKKKFDKKGYKSFISSVTDSKAHKIFKVKTGEFREKKEAELLALKITKAEGLKTYVTMKTE